MVRLITIVLSVAGLAIGVYAVATADEKPPVLPLARPASVNPFEKGVAALGVVEPAGRNVNVLPPEAGLVTRVEVEVGRRVRAGDALFKLDARTLEADLVRARASVVAAQAEIDRWHALPRAEDVPPLEAALERARALLRDREDTLARTREASQRGSGNEREIFAAQYAAEASRAEVVRAEADLAKMRAGGWAPDLAIATAALAQRQAEVAALELLVERLTVRAQRDGVVLRRSVEAGEFLGVDPRNPALIIGDLDRLAVRAQVDEEDIALVGEGSRAVARTRGARPMELALRLVRIEPFARPKSDLNGDNLERVDTRVIDVVYEVEGAPPRPLYPGQAVDVFIEAGK